MPPRASHARAPVDPFPGTALGTTGAQPTVFIDVAPDMASDPAHSRTIRAPFAHITRPSTASLRVYAHVSQSPSVFAEMHNSAARCALPHNSRRSPQTAPSAPYPIPVPIPDPAPYPIPYRIPYPRPIRSPRRSRDGENMPSNHEHESGTPPDPALSVVFSRLKIPNKIRDLRKKRGLAQIYCLHRRRVGTKKGHRDGHGRRRKPERPGSDGRD